MYWLPVAAESLSVFKMYSGGMALRSWRLLKMGSSSFVHVIELGDFPALICSMQRSMTWRLCLNWGVEPLFYFDRS